jgi:hypothetical protein
MHPVFDRALDTTQFKTAVVGNIGGLGRPGRQGAQPGRHQQNLAA